MEQKLHQGTKIKAAIKRSCAIASMLLVIPPLTSCTFHQQLPNNWTLPAPVPTGNCPDISGQYVNLGETIENKTKVPLILELFAKEYHAWMNVPFADYPFVRQKEVSHISIQQQRQTLLDIVAWKGDEVLYSKSLSQESNDFICEDGWLKIKTSIWGGGNGLLFRQLSSRNFANSAGYLLEKLEHESVGVFIIIPTTGSTVKWFRFARSER